MALTITGSGTQTCVIGTDHSVQNSTASGVFQALVNLTNLAKGDVIRVFVTSKVLTGDTEEIILEGIYSNDMGASPIILLPPWPSPFSCTLHLQQTAGTGRSVPWSLIQLA